MRKCIEWERTKELKCNFSVWTNVRTEKSQQYFIERRYTKFQLSFSPTSSLSIYNYQIPLIAFSGLIHSFVFFAPVWFRWMKKHINFVFLQKSPQISFFFNSSKYPTVGYAEIIAGKFHSFFLTKREKDDRCFMQQCVLTKHNKNSMTSCGLTTQWNSRYSISPMMLRQNFSWNFFELI